GPGPEQGGAVAGSGARPGPGPGSGSGSGPGSGPGMVVGFVGLGNMGIPMTRRLVAAGYHVRGFDASADAMRNFTDIGTSDAGGGVTAAAGLGSAGDGAAAVILMLPDSDIVERVVLGRLASEPRPAGAAG